MEASHFKKIANITITVFYYKVQTKLNKMSDENKSSLPSSEEDTTKAQRVVKYNEKFNVPEQTEEEEAETHENAEVENLADDSKIKRKKSGLQFAGLCHKYIMAYFLKRKQRKKKQGGIINNITDATYNVS